MKSFELEVLRGPPIDSRPIEIVERKGLGHPDTICDLLSERLSVVLSQHYLDCFGFILHHNVDKALLTAGRTRPAFGGGEVLEPIDLYLSGRAATEFGGKRVPIEEMAQEAVRSWFGEQFPAINPKRDVRMHCLVRPGSAELMDLFARQKEQGVLLANDTSCGVGFAPLSDLERMVLSVERRLNAPETKADFPACGKDVKVMGTRSGREVTLTIACAFVDRFLSSQKAYVDAKRRAAELALDAARSVSTMQVEIVVNAADDLARGAIYLTVTGTSAESGDDGETGRGNRANGLITPLRPMTLEAAAGKNPLTHVGKIYSVAAQRIAERMVAGLEEVREAECYLVSRIGAPIDQPQIAAVRVGTADGKIKSEMKAAIEAIVAESMSEVRHYWRGFLTGVIPVC
jgi:S-adenosylmethionine synthetase